ncbi:MAG: OmpH family outer membrane protein [Prevotella sp.]|nr:OmpH family outer membrane protein [Prevotella sp.]
MKKLTLLLFALLFSLGAGAQVKIGYFSYDKAILSMPDYQKAQTALKSLRAQYEAETQRVEDEFNKKYEEFLDGQRDFAPTILQKRQSELQELMTKNISFKREAERLLQQAESDAMEPLKKKLAAAVKEIGEEYGFSFILNTDGEQLQYVDPSMGEDINELIQDYLQ